MAGLCFFLVTVFIANAPQRLVTGLTQATEKEICIKDFIPCANSTLCIHPQSNCDGTDDCPGGTDEINCEDQQLNKFYDHIFRKRPAAENDDIGDICFLGYNGTCVCRGWDILCSHQKLQEIPEDLPRRSIVLLDFEGNKFPTLSEDFLKPISPDVQRISLSMLAPKSHAGKHWPQLAAVIAESVSIFTAGLHTGWPAPSIPKLLSNEYPFDITNDEASYITITGFVGNLCGSFGNFLVDRIGRKRTILLMSIPQILSFTLIALSYYIKELLYVARFLGGVGEGMAFTIVPLYAAEIVDPQIRGRLSAILGIMLYFGVLFANLVGSYITIKVAALSFLVFPVIFLVSFWNMPESPYYLLMKGKDEEAEKALKFLRWKDNVDKEMTNLKMDVMRQMSETGSFRDVFFIESNRKALFVSIGARFSQVAPGMAAFNLYIQVLLSNATDAISSDVGASIVLLIQVFMTSFATFVIDKWGRKPLLLFSISGCFVNLLIQTIYFVLKDYTSIDVSVIDWFPLVMMVLHIILYSMGLGMVTTIMISEMFSASVKGKLTCLVNAFYAMWSLCATKFYQATADGFGLVIPFASFGVMSLMGIFFITFYVPETKGKTLEEIQQRLKGKKGRA